LLAWGVHRRAPEDGGDGTRRDLEELAVELEEIARSIQHASRELHPPELQQTGLVESIRMACAAFSRRTGLSTLVHVHGTGREPEAAVGVAVYRIVQQALHNTLVHGCTDHATLDFSFGENSLALVIADEGRGFDVASPEFRPGLGLASMRERARLAGITLVIESTLGRGMRLSLDIPLA
jgi:signal transduction histidine kinase